MSVLANLDYDELQEELRTLSVDGWLIFDFHGLNPVAKRVIGYSGMASRRLFVFLMQDGPVAIAHRIELQGIEGFPGEIRPYAAWDELHSHLSQLVKGKRLAMEVSPEDAVPYLDRVPHGVVQLIEKFGGTVVPSAPLVSKFASKWSRAELDDHRYAAETLAEIAKKTLAEVVQEVGTAREAAVQKRVLEAMGKAGLVTKDAPIVGFGPNAANPHYEPHEGSDRLLEENQVILLDLWGGRSHQTVFGDQTWMAFSGNNPPDEVVKVWTVTRDARDAAVKALADAHESGRRVSGADLDDAARNHIREHGYGEWFVHRTGHSIDVDLHGSGPHLDNFETNDIREIIPGVGFSVEPGIYLPDRFGVRSEINVVYHDDGPEVTPKEPQRDLILPV
ncbi:MAG: M24 family metallopeptidase [Gemmatimonadota bacterium]|nr:M24 family metallopeptidase [Gemmatimonadota bacterium]MDH5805399.1 M24 family metallopeptidase [Gemmatimonadota bacterium]